MYKIKLKSNKGISMFDLMIALVIMAVFVGTVGNLYVQIASNNSRMRMNAIATYYVVQIAEYIHKIDYDNEFLDKGYTISENTIEAALRNNYGESFVKWPDNLNLSVTISDPEYFEPEGKDEDIMKQFEITAQYTVLGNEIETYRVAGIKVKEN